MPTTAVMPNEETIKQEALTVIERAKIVKIVDQDSYDQATALWIEVIKPLRKRWRDYWYGGATDLGPIPLAKKAHESLVSKFNAADEPLEAAEKQVKAEVNRWDQEQERKRQELQRQAEAAARKAEQDARAVAAAVAEEDGASEEEVEAMMSQPQTVVAPPVSPTYQKASGVSTRENYKARVTDIRKLALAVAKGQAPITYLEPNMTALNARAKADKLTMNVPGVVAYNDPTVAGRSK
jgi:hypothetical protein